MTKELTDKIEEKLAKISNDLVKDMAAKFTYPGSISTLHGFPALLSSYYQLGITDLDKISLLMDRGIWPVVEAGSRSQGSHLYSSNFCLEMYASSEVKNPDVLIYLAGEGITPFHVASTKAKLDADFSKMTGPEIEEKVKELYKEKFKPEREIKKDYPCNFGREYGFDKTCPMDELYDYH